MSPFARIVVELITVSFLSFGSLICVLLNLEILVISCYELFSVKKRESFMFLRLHAGKVHELLVFRHSRHSWECWQTTMLRRVFKLHVSLLVMGIVLLDFGYSLENVTIVFIHFWTTVVKINRLSFSLWGQRCESGHRWSQAQLEVWVVLYRGLIPSDQTCYTRQVAILGVFIWVSLPLKSTYFVQNYRGVTGGGLRIECLANGHVTSM